MSKRSYLFLAVLATGLAFQQIEAQALPFSDRAPVSEVEIEEIPAEEAEGPGDKVCFCHNITHNPHTICTANQALIQAHMDHVNGEVPGVEDSLGECPEEEIPTDDETPTDETEEPCDDHEEPVDEGEDETEEPTDEGEQPAEETEEPGDEGEEPADDSETPEEVPAEEDTDEIPADPSDPEALPEGVKVDGFEDDAEIIGEGDTAQGPAEFPAWYFEGSGNMGCSLGGVSAGTTDLAPWAFLAAMMLISPLRKIRK